MQIFRSALLFLFHLPRVGAGFAQPRRGGFPRPPAHGRIFAQPYGDMQIVGADEDSPIRGNVCEADKRVMAKP